MYENLGKQYLRNIIGWTFEETISTQKKHFANINLSIIGMYLSCFATCKTVNYIELFT